MKEEETFRNVIGRLTMRRKNNVLKVTSFIRQWDTWQPSKTRISARKDAGRRKKIKEVQFQLLISVSQTAGVPGFVTFSYKVHV